MTNDLILSNFMSFFTGHQRAYGLHHYAKDDLPKGVKESGKSRTEIDKLVTIEQYSAHINGECGLGIIPINEKNQCKFTAIDVDIYDVDLLVFIQAIENNGFPLVPFRSKSGGLHLFTFYNTFVNAKIAIDNARKMANLLSLDALVKKKLNAIIEIFPKQSVLKKDQVGNWINLPYYNIKDCVNTAIRNRESLNIDEGLAYVKSKLVSLEEVSDFFDNVPLQDAPPCLQQITILNNLKKGDGRNNYLHSLGMYLKKKHNDFFEPKLFEANQLMIEPIPKDELEKTIMQSLRKKDYNYGCKLQPMVDYCAKNICKTKEYGVGKEDGFFSILDYGTLYQIKTDQPYYEWEVRLQDSDTKDFKKLRFKNEDEIIKQDAFLKLSFRLLHVLPPKLKRDQWFKIVNQCLSDMKIISVDAEYDTSPTVIFKSLFDDFLRNRAMAQNKDQLYNGKVYYDVERHSYIFRVKDLIAYLYLTKQFRYFSTTEIHGILLDIGCQPKRIHTESKKQLRVHELHEQKLKFDLLEQEVFEADFSDDLSDKANDHLKEYDNKKDLFDA